ncbi:MAG: hypothetical protein RL318_1743 [Fibrobacterota bacterium]|jgi:small-conductance mechanosensitive channel
MNLPTFFDTFLLPAAIVVGGLILGFLIDRILLRWLKNFASRTSWEGDDILIGATKGVAILFGGLAGVHLALGYTALKPSVLALTEKGLTASLILASTFVVARIADGMVRLYTPKVEGIGSSTSILVNLAKAGVWILGGLIALQSVGISIAPLLTALGVGGLATALALQPTLSNLFSGIQILASRNIVLGDYVRLDSGDEGQVVDITWRHTAIRSMPGNLILVPNARIASAIVTNYHGPTRDMGVGVSASCAYGSDLSTVEAACLEVAREVLAQIPGGVVDSEPSFRITALADSAIQFSVGFRAKEFADQFLLKHEMLRRLYERFQRDGIEIPFPSRTVHIASQPDKVV